ncbi:MAG: hypothetical protein ACJ78Q_02365, partial [Chloroflexia bacterium]
MNYTPNQQEASPKPAPNFAETTGAGPLAQTPGSATYSPNVTSTGRPQRRARMEQIGFWVVVVAALALLLVVLNVFLPRFISGAVLGFDIAAFVGLLTLL